MFVTVYGLLILNSFYLKHYKINCHHTYYVSSGTRNAIHYLGWAPESVIWKDINICKMCNNNLDMFVRLVSNLNTFLLYKNKIRQQYSLIFPVYLSYRQELVTLSQLFILKWQLDFYCFIFSLWQKYNKFISSISSTDIIFCIKCEPIKNNESLIFLSGK